MMMPANYSAIAENEMTYVIGGGLTDILAPAMTAENWQNVSYNLIQIVGNTFLQKNVTEAFTKIFGGTYHVGDITTSAFDFLKKTWKNNYGYGDNAGKAEWAFGNGVLNVGLQIVGTLASIYTLGSGKVGLDVKKY